MDIMVKEESCYGVALLYEALEREQGARCTADVK
jgi:hypothetical protein